MLQFYYDNRALYLHCMFDYTVFYQLIAMDAMATITFNKKTMWLPCEGSYSNLVQAAAFIWYLATGCKLRMKTLVQK